MEISTYTIIMTDIRFILACDRICKDGHKDEHKDEHNMEDGRKDGCKDERKDGCNTTPHLLIHCPP